jgi:hypothetical protein
MAPLTITIYCKRDLTLHDPVRVAFLVGVLSDMCEAGLVCVDDVQVDCHEERETAKVWRLLQGQESQ